LLLSPYVYSLLFSYMIRLSCVTNDYIDHWSLFLLGSLCCIVVVREALSFCRYVSRHNNGTGVGAQSTLGVGQDILSRKYMYEKLTKCPNFTYLPEKYFSKFWGSNAPSLLSPTHMNSSDSRFWWVGRPTPSMDSMHCVGFPRDGVKCSICKSALCYLAKIHFVMEQDTSTLYVALAK